jgi:hypothetical protein
MMTYDFRGFGVTRCVYTLSAETFRVECPGPQVGKSLHEVTVPVTSITGFHVMAPLRFQGSLRGAAMNTALAVQGMAGEFLLAWSDNGKPRTKSFSMINVTDASFMQLVYTLARQRPDADFRALSTAAFKSRFGMWSDTKKALAFIAGVFLFLGILLAYFELKKRLGY